MSDIIFEPRKNVFKPLVNLQIYVSTISFLWIKNFRTKNILKLVSSLLPAVVPYLSRRKKMCIFRSSSVFLFFYAVIFKGYCTLVNTTVNTFFCSL